MEARMEMVSWVVRVESKSRRRWVMRRGIFSIGGERGEDKAVERVGEH